MKKLLFLAPVLGILFATCSNEFEIAAPWKSIPVLYGIISPKDTAHYIRLEKAFLDPDVSALTIAQIPDSLYYAPNEVAVYLQKVGETARYPLHRVDGVLEGIVRDSGIFAGSPNWLYKIKPTEFGGLQQGATYKVIVERADGSPTVSAETTIPANFQISKPNPDQTPPIMNFTVYGNTDVAWYSDVNGLYFNVWLKVRYREIDETGGLVKRDTLTWLAAENVKREETPTGASGSYYSKASLSGRNFVKLLTENIEPTTTHYRIFEGIDILLIGGGYEIEQYLITAQTGSGLTGAEALPTYTNLKPEGAGYGIFTSKNSIDMVNIKIGTKTVDSLNQYSPAVHALRFTY